MRKVVPRPGSDCTDSVPPCAATMVRLIESPSPMPPGLVVKKGWKMRASVCSSMPHPESVTSMHTPDSVGRAQQRDLTRAGLARFHRVDAVQQQIEEHLLELHTVAHELRQRLRNLDRERDSLRGRLAADETQDLVDHFAEVELGSSPPRRGAGSGAAAGSARWRADRR